ncbi:flavin reductase [Streptomyces sp. F001]|uniref:flavin reductase family protein n=1 Tax=Streptomyces sp. F001 TaxID=1510026 RepID=UPI00101E46B5|nr:flavin reductase family protein [Streptomyces sp. F001]RZB16065.1 flavin reductase [Streptomyces sp. F001]
MPATASPPPDTAAQQAFRDAMATVASPVAVVTAMNGRRPHGTTVSAFASLSLTPPMVMVSLDTRSHLLAIIRRTGRFGLNVLGTHQAELAAAFAHSGPDKFQGSPGRQ